MAEVPHSADIMLSTRAKQTMHQIAVGELKHEEMKPGHKLTRILNDIDVLKRYSS